MARPRPCMACNELLDVNGDCSTKDCAYNPRSDMQEHETDLKVGDEIDHTGGELDGDDLGDLSEDDLAELLTDDDEPFDPESVADTDELDGMDDSPKHDERDEAAEDSDKMDLSQEDLPEQEAPKNQKDQKPSEHEDLEDLPDDLKDKLDEQLQEFMEQLAEENSETDYEAAEDFGEHPDDDDPNLPTRPRGCDGNCQPKDDPSETDEPCPHCTAKQFRDQMEGEEKERDQEDLKQEFENFMDEWNKQAEQDGNQHEGEGGDTPDYDEKIADEGEESSEERARDELGDEQNRQDEIEDERQERQGENDPDDDPDLPPRPQGCSGDCQPGDDPDGEPCPHCTAKQFKLSLEEQQEQDEDFEMPEGEEFEKMLDDFRKEWEKGENKLDDPPEDSVCGYNIGDSGDGPVTCSLMKGHKGQHRSELLLDDEEPPEDELQDLPEDEQKKKEYEDGENEDEEKSEFKRIAKDMTVTQEKRFDNLVERLEKKVESTFGNTAEDIHTMRKTDGQFEGEEISQSIQISSRGVTYWVTIAAAKEM